jgi:predicted 3-demethylubiquinone-9 3-methyltransferase (glyoxalase superfamily)
MQLSKITPFLWYDGHAVEAVKLYTSVFPNSKVIDEQVFEVGAETKMISITFELDGVRMIAFNGGPMFKLTEAFSLMVHCENQKEVDYYWEKLGEGGEYLPCGWLRDRFGLSWQIVPVRLLELLRHPDHAKAQAAMQAMLQMKKIELAALEKAAGS